MKGIIGLLVVAVALALLNPGMDDFKSYLENRTANQAGNQTGSALGKLVGKLAGAAVDLGAFERKNYYVASVYSSGSGEKSDVYLGVAKFFLKIR